MLISDKKNIMVWDILQPYIVFMNTWQEFQTYERNVSRAGRTTILNMTNPPTDSNDDV